MIFFPYSLPHFAQAVDPPADTRRQVYFSCFNTNDQQHFGVIPEAINTMSQNCGIFPPANWHLGHGLFMGLKLAPTGKFRHGNPWFPDGNIYKWCFVYYPYPIPQHFWCNDLGWQSGVLHWYCIARKNVLTHRLFYFIHLVLCKLVFKYTCMCIYIQVKIML